MNEFWKGFVLGMIFAMLFVGAIVIKELTENLATKDYVQSKIELYQQHP